MSPTVRNLMSVMIMILAVMQTRIRKKDLTHKSLLKTGERPNTYSPAVVWIGYFAGSLMLLGIYELALNGR